MKWLPRILLSLLVGATIPVPTASASSSVTITGRISVTPKQVALVSGHRSWRLAGSRPFASGSTVTVTGTVSGSTFNVSSSRLVAAPRALSTTGNQTVYAILAEWSGADSETAADLAAAISSTGDWFNVVSAGRLTGFTISGTQNFVHIAAPSGCDYQTIFANAVAAAGITEANYDHVVVYFPSYGACSWAGLGEEPGHQVWLNGFTETSVIAHEIGHNLGLWHAHSLTCSAPSAGPDTATASDNCAWPPNEYGDPADTMGNEGGSGAPWYDAPHLAQVGWLGSDLATPSACAGTVHVAPIETPGAVRALAIDAGGEVHPQRPGVLTEPVTYWVEVRQATGLDAGMSSGLTDGVLLHMTDAFWTTDSPPTQNFGTDLLDGTADGSSAFGDAAVPVGATVTTPQGMSIHVDGVDTTGANVTITSSTPSVPQSIVAAAGAGNVHVSWQPPACNGGAAITSYTVTALNDDGSLAASVTTAATNATLAIAPSTDRQIFVSATNANSLVGPAAVAPIAPPRIISSVVYTSPSFDQFQVTIAPSVANGGMNINGYMVHCIGPDGDKGSYIPPGSSSTGTYGLTHGATYTVYVAPIVRPDGTEGPASPALTMVAGDNKAPSVALGSGANTWRLAASATAGWHGSDSGGAGVASYDVRVRSASATSGLGAWSMPSSLQHTTRTSTALGLAAGGTTCYAVRARDNNGNLSGWSAAACFSRPLDDRALTAGTGWKRLKGSAYYLGTVTSATKSGVVLKRAHVHASAVLLLVTKCKTCGSLVLVEGSKTLKPIALTSPTTRNRVQITVTLPTKANGVTITIKTTNAKTVRIDALGLRAY